MKELMIQRSKWLRGEVKSRLLRPSDGKMCCLGFYALSCGLSHEQIKDHAEPADIAGILPNEMIWTTRGPEGFKNAWPLILTNDDAGISESKREENITKYFAEHNVHVKFVD